MSEGRTKLHCCSDEHLLIVGSGSDIEVLDVKRKKWKDVKFPNNYATISGITILGDRVYMYLANISIQLTGIVQ